jgi:D-alanine-D-alanine ligase
MSDSKIKVAVLAGGISSERQISFQTGRCVADALREGGYETIVADITPKDLRVLDDKSIDVFFICLHGEFGEDGQLQKILEERGLCYTHSDSFTSKTAMDKITAKAFFKKAGVKTPKHIRFNDSHTFQQIEEKVPSETGKYVAKPVCEGSSVGVDIVDGARAAITQCCLNKSVSTNYMIEEFIPGRELTVGVLNGKALPILEIKPKVEFYDFHAKYVDDNTEYLFDTVTDDKLIESISRDAVKCFECIGCRHVARVDYSLTNDGVAYALEINTVPGMTVHSCVPKAAAKIGIPMSKLCGLIIEQAIVDHEETKNITVKEVAAGGKKKKENQIFPQTI